MLQMLPLITSLLLLLTSQSLCASQAEIKFAYVGDIENSAYAGVVQGLDEANMQGQFLGQKYVMRTFPGPAELPDNAGDYIAILSALPTDELLLLHEKARYHAVFNLVAEDDSLRRDCRNNILNIIPSARMKQDAIAQWQQKHPGANVIAQAWHEDFVKFAARDLNKRFRKAFNKGMDDYAWAGWAAVRMTADSVVREGLTEPVALLSYLKTRLAFDGQKGLNMNFRETGQLRQLLLLVEDNSIVGEAPVRGVSSDIDSLGTAECAK